MSAPGSISPLASDYADAAGRAALVARLREEFADRLTTGADAIHQHSHDESYHPPHPPDAVVFARSTEEVALVLRECSAARVPVVPFGVGSSLEGGVSAPFGGVSLDLTGMDQVLRVSAEDLDATVQAGVTHPRLNEVLRDHGVFFSVDPGAPASIGGMVATRASGTTAVRYGTMRENVLGLTAVLADGTVVTTGGRSRKSSAGYDLTRLLVGSEGTLAVVTDVTVRLHPTPEAVAAATCAFPTLSAAVDAVVTFLRSGIPVARAELLDEVMIRAVNAYSGLTLTQAPTLFVELHGGPEGVAEQLREVESISADCGGSDFAAGRTPEERSRLWRARHDALPAAKAMRAGASTWSTDVCVPISRLAECIEATKADVTASGLMAPIAGHVGDGNFHLAFVLDPADADEMRRAVAVNERMVALALSMGGTCTGEHGVGAGKMEFLRAEHGAGVDVMLQLKRALDPLGILNPGKVVAAG